METEKKDYSQLRRNPPKIQDIPKEVKEVIYTMVSCMCNNVSFVRFKKNDAGEFRLSHFNSRNISLAFSNLQSKTPVHDMTWMADDGEWSEVWERLDDSTSAVHSVKFR
jgi:hypothetical protein